jgi:hypothetical protein
VTAEKKKYPSIRRGHMRMTREGTLKYVEPTITGVTEEERQAWKESHNLGAGPQPGGPGAELIPQTPIIRTLKVLDIDRTPLRIVLRGDRKDFGVIASPDLEFQIGETVEYRDGYSINYGDFIRKVSIQ